MSNNYDTPGLWLDTVSLQQRCDQATFARGLELYRGQKVLAVDIQPFKNAWQVKGTVQGSQRQPYLVTISVTRSFNGQLLSWDSNCTCPVGEQCKHGIALLIKAAYQGHALLLAKGISSMTKPPSAEEQAIALAAEQTRVATEQAQNAEKEVTRWLAELQRCATSVSAPAADPSHNDLRQAKKEQYLYLASIVYKQNIKEYPQLQLEVVTSYRKGNGDWAKAKIIKAQPERGQPIFDAATEADHDILQLMRAMPVSGQYSYYGYSLRSKVVIEGKYGVLALEKAASTGRLFIGDLQSQPLSALQWDAPLALGWVWHEVTSSKTGNSACGWVPRPRLNPSSARLCLNNPPLYLDATAGKCGLADVQDLSLGQVAVLLKTPPLKADALKKHQPELLQRLGPVPLPPMLEQLDTLTGISPSACLHLQPVTPERISQDGLMRASLSFDYAGWRGWWVGQGVHVLVENAQGRHLLQRDPQAELEAIIRLRDMGFTSDGRDHFGIPGDSSQQRWLQLADSDYAELRQAGFEITLDAALTDWISRADLLSVDLSAHDGEESATSPWFDLSLGMEINGARHNILPWLPELIAVAANSPRDEASGLPNIPPFIYLNDPNGGFIRLPTDNLKPWLGALLELVGDREHDFSGDSLKLSRYDALRTTASLGEGAVWSGPQHLRDMVRQLGSRAELPSVPLPASVNASLRPYQQQGVDWLQFLRQYSLAGILADDMGLGKTLQTLVHIQIEKDAGRLTEPALIIAPVSLMGNWRRETERFCPELRCLVIHGIDRHEVSGSTHEHDIVIAPYSLLPRDRDGWLQGKWHLVVLDEAQNIKNANTYAAEVVSGLNTRHRLCLSGTPMENNLGEIWSLFHFLMPGFLGSQKRFTEVFRKPIEKLGDAEAMRQLRARVTPFMLRRTKALVAHELPPKVETVMRVELDGKQADLYETIRLGMEKTVREALSTKGLAKSQITILDALLKLRQVCCDPHLVKLDAARKVKNSAKLEQLMELLPEMLAEGRRILLFSQFTSMLSLIEDELVKRKINWVKLTGQSQKRDALIEQFTSGKVPLFLISLKAGGVGLNLPQADTVIHYDPWWNPAVENQATDRAHRIGQTQSVWVVKLVAQGTIEERILALQERKAALAESMYSGSVGRKQPLFSESDLAELLKPLSV